METKIKDLIKKLGGERNSFAELLQDKTITDPNKRLTLLIKYNTTLDFIVQLEVILK